MSQSQEDRAAQFYAETYDESVPGWPDEIGFYREMAADATRAGVSILELACGTGRVAIRLAREGAGIVGLELSQKMLDMALRKSVGLENPRWIRGDMRSFQLDEAFGLVIIPGHSFQHLNTPEEQLACLGCVKRHLTPEARLVVHLDHQDMAWLGELVGPKGGRFEPTGQFTHPLAGKPMQTFRAWSYERSTQTAICQTRWEEIDAAGNVADSWHRGPIRLHCVFRFEMEHLLARAGFAVEFLYGDFSRRPLCDSSSEMIWVAHAAREGSRSQAARLRTRAVAAPDHSRQLTPG
jgi:ubiquinone/menaquinone biosynthesis C-methylase UbiE